jgi:arabinose-5-phosphate isomerase
MATRRPPRPQTAADHLAYGRWVIRAEAATLASVAARLGDSFVRAAEILAECAGRVAVTGVGKSADIGQKIAGTLNSTGTRAYPLDATRAVHGDLGMVHPDDVAVVLSHSGESEELVRLLGPLSGLASRIIAVTGNPDSTLARRADVAVVYGPVEEACPLSLAPSASTTAMLAVGDALAFVLSGRRDFTEEDFARYHPAGSLGRKLAGVEMFMRRGDELRIAAARSTVRDVFATSPPRGRRTGAVMLVDGHGKLVGLFTDSDLAKLFERGLEAALDRPMSEVMTRTPLTLAVGAKLAEATDLLRRHKISELPVVDDAGRPVGLLDITDVIGLAAAAEERPAPLKRRSA